MQSLAVYNGSKIKIRRSQLTKDKIVCDELLDKLQMLSSIVGAVGTKQDAKRFMKLAGEINELCPSHQENN